MFGGAIHSICLLLALCSPIDPELPIAQSYQKERMKFLSREMSTPPNSTHRRVPLLPPAQLRRNIYPRDSTSAEAERETAPPAPKSVPTAGWSLGPWTWDGTAETIAIPLILLCLLCIIVENFRLRRKVRKMEREREGSDNRLKAEAEAVRKLAWALESVGRGKQAKNPEIDGYRQKLKGIWI